MNEAIVNQHQTSGILTNFSESYQPLLKLQGELQEPEAPMQDHLLTGMACLEPLSRACLSRFARLWGNLPAPLVEIPAKAEAAAPKDETPPLVQHMLGQVFGDLLEQGLEGLFATDPLNTPAGPQIACDVKKDLEGNISVECTLPGNFK